MKRFLKKPLLLVLIATILCGCQTSNTYIIDDAYASVDGGAQINDYQLPLSYVDGMASSLAVVEYNKANTENMNTIQSPIGLLVNISSQKVLLSKAAFTKTYPASTTKIMTALLALENADYDTYYSVHDFDRIEVENAVICDYRNGDDLSFDIVLHGALLPSGNDAAIILSRFVTEDQSDFVAMMNAKAKELGATQTNFVNPHGLHDPNHYTTAYDMYLIFQEAVKNKTFRKVIHESIYSSNFTRKTDYSTYRINVEYKTTNRFFLNEYAYPNDITLVGGKSGYTGEAGYNYVMLFTHEDEEYIMVIMGSKTKDQIYIDMQKLMQLVSDAPLKYINDVEEETVYSDHE